MMRNRHSCVSFNAEMVVHFHGFLVGVCNVLHSPIIDLLVPLMVENYSFEVLALKRRKLRGCVWNIGLNTCIF